MSGDDFDRTRLPSFAMLSATSLGGEQAHQNYLALKQDAVVPIRHCETGAATGKGSRGGSDCQSRKHRQVRYQKPLVVRANLVMRSRSTLTIEYQPR
jgi:hypothetical protein